MIAPVFIYIPIWTIIDVGKLKKTGEIIVIYIPIWTIIDLPINVHA